MSSEFSSPSFAVKKRNFNQQRSHTDNEPPTANQTNVPDGREQDQAAMVWRDEVLRLFVGAILLTALAALAVGLRFVSRGRILRVLGPTDWFMLVTVAVSVGNAVGVGFAVPNGLGLPFHELSPEQRRQYLRIQYINTILNYAGLVFTKLSVLLLFLDVFVVTWVREASYVVMAAVAVHGAWLIGSNILVCVPIHRYWEPLDPPDNSCMMLLAPAKFLAEMTLNVVFDFVILFLPLPVVWSMTLPPMQKLWLYFLAAMGLVVCLMSVLRFVFLHNAIVRNDPSAVGIDVFYWTTIEINLAIVIACVPTLRPLAAKLCPRLVATPGSKASEDGHPPTIWSAPLRLRSVERITF